MRRDPILYGLVIGLAVIVTADFVASPKDSGITQVAEYISNAVSSYL